MRCAFVFRIAFALSFIAPASAQNYPAKPIRIVIAQAPGSATDVISRIVGSRLGEALGQSMIVDARPGAGGVLGTEIAARAPADGYTLFMGNNSTHGSNPALYAKLPYDAIKDFSPIILVVATPYVLNVHPSLPVKTVKELIVFAKARPGQINYASAGNGSTHHFCGELLKSLGGIDIVHVPYKGSTPGLMALVSGDGSMMFSNVDNSQPHIKSGRTRPLAVTSAKRAATLPEVPTMEEAGVRDFQVLSWFGLLAPAGTPPAVIARVNAETVKVLARPDVKAALAAQGMDVMSGTPEQFANHIKSEIKRMTKIADSAGITAD